MGEKIRKKSIPTRQVKTVDMVVNFRVHEGDSVVMKVTLKSGM